jgi:hypothetical protein
VEHPVYSRSGDSKEATGTDHAIEKPLHEQSNGQYKYSTISQKVIVGNYILSHYRNSAAVS